MSILGSGSFSARLDARWSGYINNQFHLVRVEGRDATHKCIFGFVESWTYLCSHGWKPSEISNGIAHKSPFGAHVPPEELRTKLKMVIEANLKRGTYLKWEKIEAGIPSLKYLPMKRIIEALDDLAGELNFTRHGNFSDEIILLWER